MEDFAPVFENKECHLEFFLNLPLTTVKAQPTSKRSKESSSTREMNEDEVEDGKSKTSSMFTSVSASMNEDDHDDETGDRTSIISSVEGTPKKKKNKSSQKNKNKKSNDNIVSPNRGTHTIFKDTEEEVVEMEGRNLSESLEEENDANNDSFDIESIRAQAPKLASMLEEGKQVNQAGQPTSYYGPLDSQSVYEEQVPKKFQRFTLKADTTGFLNVINYVEIEKNDQTDVHRNKIRGILQ